MSFNVFLGGGEGGNALGAPPDPNLQGEGQVRGFLVEKDMAYFDVENDIYLIRARFPGRFRAMSLSIAIDVAPLSNDPYHTPASRWISPTCHYGIVCPTL